MYKNKYIKLIGSPKIFSFLVIWMMVLVFVGTLVQKDIGLYAAQQEYFSSWFKWISFIPLPSGRLTMLVMFLNLSCYFFRPGIFRSNKAGITITHLGVILMLVGGGLTSFFSHEGNLIFEEGQTVDFYENYYEKEFVVVDVSNRDFDNFTVFSSKLLYEENLLSHSSIPFEIKILDYFINCKPSSRIYQGSEEFKGNDTIKDSGQLLQKSKLNYAGFVEGDDIFTGNFDLVVTDGFAGNIALKSIEGVANIISHFIKSEFNKNIFTKISAIISYPVMKAVKKKMDPRRYNGASLLGLQGIVVKSHGSADSYAFSRAINTAYYEVKNRILNKITSLIDIEMSDEK